MFRTIRSESVRKVNLSEIEKVQVKGEKITLLTKDLTQLIIVDFNKVRVRNNEPIKKALIELN